MKKHLPILIASLMVLLAFSAPGCKSYNRHRTINAGDHNVTIVRKPSRKPIKRNYKPIPSSPKRFVN